MPHCPNCGKEIASQSLERIVDMVMLYPQDERINVLAPIVRGRKGEFKKELAGLRVRGYTKARIDGQFRALEDDIKLDRRRNHTIEVVVDRVIVRGGVERRLTESVDVALNLADDIVVINTFEGGDRLFSRRLACVDCGLSMPEMTPRAFSFNSPHGACPECQGLGAMIDFDPQRVVPDETQVAGRRRDRAVGAGRPQAGEGSAAGAVARLRHRSERAVRAAAEEVARGAAVRRRQGDSKGCCRTCAAATTKAAGRSRRSSDAFRIAAAVPGVPRPAAEAAEPRRSR